MENQEPDGSERRTAIFIAVALSLLVATCFAAVGFVGMGAVLFYRLTDSQRTSSALHADPASPPMPIMAEPPVRNLNGVQPD